jgi:hypothetical protein
MSDETTNRNPFRCFNGAFLGGALLIGVAIVVLARFGRGFELGSPARLTIASVQALLLAGIAAWSVISIRRLDELLFKLHLEAIAISFTITGALIAGWGMLEKAGAPRVEWGLWTWPLMTMLWGVAAAIRSRQYR